MPATKAKPAPGYKGATVVSFDENAPRVLVAKFMTKFPTASREEICQRIAMALNSTHSKYLPAFIRYATINAWNAVRDGERSAEVEKNREQEVKDATAAPSRAVVPVDPVARREHQEVRTVERANAKEIVKLLLLNLIAPNGKLWGDLSIAEYMTIGQKQFQHGAKMIRAGHKKGELLKTATDDNELAKVFA